MLAPLPHCGRPVLKEIRAVVMKNGQQEKMHLQQHQGAGGGGPPVSIPEVTTHSHILYQRFSRPADKKSKNERYLKESINPNCQPGPILILL
jgi:hypothetical protein